MNAASADWQVNNNVIVYGSLIFYPTREFRVFDGQVMALVGIYEGVPIYTDTTRGPFTAIYVPVSSVQLRRYEHPQTVQSVGTPLGTPPVRVESVVVGPTVTPTTAVATVAVPPVTVVVPSAVVGTAGTITPRATDVAASAPRTPRRSTIETIQRPRGTNGVWLEFNGARWFSAGDAVSYSPDRFTPIGQYRSFTVYRDRTTNSNEIWVAAVKDGPIAPYKKR